MWSFSHFFGEVMKMFVYKITNDVNDKMYIGQTINPIEERFRRHINSAINNELDTHFARAIRKIGPEHFKIELIDTASSQEELTEKEYYWIHYYDATHKGYNETDNKIKCGGNTYASKTEEEMKIIGEKIRQTKLGGLNPRARAVKCRNIKTNEEFHFESLSKMQEFFNESNHAALGKRCTGRTKSLYREVWQISYEENEFSDEIKIGRSTYNSKDIQVIELDKNITKIFRSGAAIEREYNLARHRISKTKIREGNHFIINNLDITILE